MRFLSIILFVNFYLTPIASQVFAPVGAKWTYTELFAFEEDISYAAVEVLKDTIIQGKLCVEIDAANFCGFPEDLQYVNTSHDSVFLYDPRLNDFKLIYAFNTPPGGSWKIPIPGWDNITDTIIVYVDAVSTIVVNSLQLNVQHVTYVGLDYYEYGFKGISQYSSDIVELLGDLEFIFLIPLDLSAVCDFNFSGGLRCYEDGFIGQYETGIAPDCHYTTVGLNEPHVSSLGLHPNPTSGIVNLNIDRAGLKSIVLRDNLGRVVKTFSKDEAISLQGMANGIYFIQIITIKNEYFIEKVVKYDN